MATWLLAWLEPPRGVTQATGKLGLSLVLVSALVPARFCRAPRCDEMAVDLYGPLGTRGTVERDIRCEIMCRLVDSVDPSCRRAPIVAFPDMTTGGTGVTVAAPYLGSRLMTHEVRRIHGGLDFLRVNTFLVNQTDGIQDIRF